MSDVIKPQIRELTDKLKKGMHLEDGGVITADDDLFENTLPEDVTPSDVKKVFGHVENLAAATTLAAGEIGMPAMKKDKSLDSVTAEVKMGRHGSVSSNFARSQEGPKGPGSKEKVVRYGVSSTKVNTVASKSNRGDLKKVRGYLSENAQKLFG